MRMTRRARELVTITAMVALYCRTHHGSRHGAFCFDCSALLDYARQRLDRCRFGDGKPTCAQCPVHCYRPAERDRVRAVMRWAGPRMIWRHPVLALRHLIDGKKRVRP